MKGKVNRNMYGSAIRNRNLLDIKRLIKIARKREKELRETITLNFKLEKNNISLENLFKSDMISKRGFIIDTEIRYEDQGMDASLVELDSLFSAKYGVKESDPAIVKERKYTCNCEEDNIKCVGDYCEKCGSWAVEHKYVRGWLCLDKFKIFNPDILNMFIKNKKPGMELKKPYKYRPDNSNPDKYPWLSNQDFKYNIYNLQNPELLREFIVEYSKPENLSFFLDRIDMFMMSTIPVMSKNLRHHHIVTKFDGTPDIRSHEINGHFMLINNKVDELNRGYHLWSSGRVTRYLADINKGFATIHQEVCKIIGDGKSSDLRGKIGGVRKGHSSKLVIEGSMDHITHICSISYASFGVMFLDWHYELFEDMGMLSDSEYRIRNMMPNKDDFPILAKVLRVLQEQDLAWVAGYRPPTLYKCSWQGMFITALTRDGAVRVTEINLGENYKGDHDGDQLLMFALDPRIRMQMGFAFNGRRTVYDPITGDIASNFELQESIYFLCYRLFPKEVKLDDILEPTRLEVMDEKFRVSDSYGELYDQEAVIKFGKKINSNLYK